MEQLSLFSKPADITLQVHSHEDSRHRRPTILVALSSPHSNSDSRGEYESVSGNDCPSFIALIVTHTRAITDIISYDTRVNSFRIISSPTLTKIFHISLQTLKKIFHGTVKHE